MESKPGLAYRIQNIDTRIIHTLIIVLILIPLIKPIGLPVQISRGTQMAYDRIDQLKSGDTVLYVFDLAASIEAEIYPTAIAWLHHLMGRGVRVVTVAVYTVEGPMYADRAFDTLGPQYGYEYGKDFVNLGYAAGFETAAAAIGRDIRSVYPEDFYGTPITSLDLMNEIEDINDFDLLLMSANWGPDIWVRQLVTLYNVPMVHNCTGIVAPGAQAYLSAGQIQGLVGALSGGAEYEVLLGKPGAAAAAMDAQSTTHGLTVLLVVLANIAFYASRGKSKSEGGR